MRFETLGVILAVSITAGIAHACGVDLETATRATLRALLRQ